MISEILTDANAIIPGADSHNNTHYVRVMPQLNGDTVTVVVDPYKQPNRVVTVMRDSREVKL